MMGPMILGCRGLRKHPKQGHHGSNVLTCPGEVWEGFIVLDDPLLHVVGHGTRMPTVSVALDLRAFLLELESCFFELLVPRPQLLYPQARPSVGVAPPTWMLLMYPSRVPVMKHSREG